LGAVLVDSPATRSTVRPRRSGNPDTWRPPARRRATVDEAVEVARRRLRDGHRLEAAELLDRCVRALARDGVDDRELAERWAYAQDRCTGDGGSSLPPDVVQRSIVWVTGEDLEAGRRELAADRPFAAARCFAAADAIDARGTRSAFLHATALHRAAVQAVRRATVPDNPAGPAADVVSHLEGAERCLHRATPLTRRALADPSLGLAAEELLASIRVQLGALQQRRANAVRMAAACACLVDYQAFVRGSALTVSGADQDSFRSSLANLAGRITRLRGGAPAGSAEARLLATLADGVADLQSRLPVPRRAPARR
jgi:hypothetical protein